MLSKAIRAPLSPPTSSTTVSPPASRPPWSPQQDPPPPRSLPLPLLFMVREKGVRDANYITRACWREKLFPDHRSWGFEIGLTKALEAVAGQVSSHCGRLSMRGCANDRLSMRGMRKWGSVLYSAGRSCRRAVNFGFHAYSW